MMVLLLLCKCLLWWWVGLWACQYLSYLRTGCGQPGPWWQQFTGIAAVVILAQIYGLL